jgi:hypothetical protein
MGQRQMGQSASQSMIGRLLLSSVIDSHAKDREIIVVGRCRWPVAGMGAAGRSAVGGAAGIIVMVRRHYFWARCGLKRYCTSSPYLRAILNFNIRSSLGAFRRSFLPPKFITPS